MKFGDWDGYKRASLGDIYIRRMDDRVKEQIMGALRMRHQGESIIVPKDCHSNCDQECMKHEIQTQIGDAIGLNFNDKTNVAK